MTTMSGSRLGREEHRAVAASAALVQCRRRRREPIGGLGGSQVVCTTRVGVSVLMQGGIDDTCVRRRSGSPITFLRSMIEIQTSHGSPNDCLHPWERGTWSASKFSAVRCLRQCRTQLSRIRPPCGKPRSPPRSTADPPIRRSAGEVAEMDTEPGGREMAEDRLARTRCRSDAVEGAARGRAARGGTRCAPLSAICRSGLAGVRFIVKKNKTPKTQKCTKIRAPRAQGVP